MRRKEGRRGTLRVVARRSSMFGLGAKPHRAEVNVKAAKPARKHPSLTEDIAEPATGYQTDGKGEGVAGDDEFRFGEGRAQR